MKKFFVLLWSAAMVTIVCSCALAETTKKASEYGYTEQNIPIDTGDHQIPATVTCPTDEAGELFPAVIMLHGNGSTRHEAGNAYDYTAPEIAKAGIVTIRFDYISDGGSTSDYIDITYDKSVADAIKCYEYLSGLGIVDMAHVGIMGWSQGGRLALLTAGRNDVFTSVLTWSGAYDQKGNEEEQYEIAKKNGCYYEVTYSWREPPKHSPAYYECAMSIDYPATVAAIKAPILAIAGTEDTTVLPWLHRRSWTLPPTKPPKCCSSRVPTTPSACSPVTGASSTR